LSPPVDPLPVSPREGPRKVSVFVTCLVDFLFPEVGEAMVRVLRRFGLEVEFPRAQTCCGQPAFNAGFRREARRIARHFLEVFETSPAVVCPSGSCAAMVKESYRQLFSDEPDLCARFHALAARTWELSQFLTEVLGVRDFPGELSASLTWHDSCHSLRGLGVKEGPRRLLRSIAGVELRELDDAQVCCGFGGLFSVKFAEISAAMLEDKVARVEKSGADCVVATDSSCLMHIGGGLERQGAKARAVHIAEVLAGALDGASGGGRGA
jgi:L-lactate dehydrogenase complex protein LldE